MCLCLEQLKNHIKCLREKLNGVKLIKMLPSAYLGLEIGLEIPTAAETRPEWSKRIFRLYGMFYNKKGHVQRGSAAKRSV